MSEIGSLDLSAVEVLPSILRTPTDNIFLPLLLNDRSTDNIDNLLDFDILSLPSGDNSFRGIDDPNYFPIFKGHRPNEKTSSNRLTDMESHQPRMTFEECRIGRLLIFEYTNRSLIEIGELDAHFHLHRKSNV